MAALASFIVNEHWQPQNPTDSTSASFCSFPKLPPELRLMVYEAAIPGPRLVTRTSKQISLGAASLEASCVVQSKYTPILNPSFNCIYPNSTTTLVNLETDIVLKNLVINKSGWVSRSIFDLENDQLKQQRLIRRFTGLSKVKHLAVEFDFPRSDCTKLYLTLQVCCPELESLTFCVFNQRRVQETFYEQQLIDMDSNFLDYAWFRTSFEPTKELRIWARHLLQSETYRYVSWKSYLVSSNFWWNKVYRPEWTPTLQVSALARLSKDGSLYYLWEEEVEEGDFSDDSSSFLAYVRLTDGEGRFFSRYDGIERLFSEAEV